MSDPATPDANAQVSIESEGRVLTGVGVSAESLEAVMDRHAPEPETATPAPAVTPAATPTPEQPVSRGRQRFADLTHERDTAKAETVAERTKREAAEQRIAALETQLQQARTPQQAQQAQQALTQETNRQAAQRFTFPSYEQFAEQYPTATYDDWQDAKDDARYQWRKANDPDLNLDMRVRQSLDADRASRSLVETVEKSRAKGREVYKDFDAVQKSGPGAQIPLGMDAQTAMARAVYVVNHPQSEHLQYAIMKDGDLAQSLARMSDIDFGMAIARLAPHGTTPAPARPAIPAPYQPVGSGSPTVSVPSSELAKGHDYDRSGYREKRAAERKLRRA